MADVKDLLAYILLNYPNKEELSKTRVTKLIYLCDWKSCIEFERQITDITWVFDNFGPFVWDVMTTVENNPETFSIYSSETLFGTPKTVVALKNKQYSPSLEEQEKRIADFVIKSTENLNFDKFVKLVYSTYPIMTSQRHKALDLIDLAKEYKRSIIFRKITPKVAFQ